MGAASAQQPELGQLDASPTLFTVMAAVNAAGYDAMIDSPSNSPLRKRVRDSLAKMNIPSLPALKEFFAKHNQISPYISFALTCEGPPNFVIRKRDIEVPPDVTQMTRLTPLLAAFYKEAHVEDLWQSAQPEINQTLARYHSPVIDAVMKVNLYLRQQTSGGANRARFQILVELLGAPNQVHTRSYGFQYTIVVTPSPEIHIFEIRHAFLHYSLDPLATHYADILERKKGLAEHAFRAQALDDYLKNDWLGLAGESLVKAVESRLDRNPAEVQKALRQGMVLAPYFAENLPAYEKQDLAMSEFYKDMVQAIDVVEGRPAADAGEIRCAARIRTHGAIGRSAAPAGIDRRGQDARRRGKALCRARSGKGQGSVPRRSAADRYEADARRGLLWAGAHRRAAEGSRIVAAPLPQDVGTRSGAAGQGLDARLSRQAFARLQRAGRSRKIFSTGDQSRRRVRSSHRRSQKIATTDFETIRS